MKVVQNEISFPSSFSIDHRFAPPPPTLTRKDNIIPSTEALSLNNMEKPRIPHHLAIRLYPRKSESRWYFGRSIMHRDFSCRSGKKGKHLEEKRL